jgi:hypothetical protein
MLRNGGRAASHSRPGIAGWVHGPERQGDDDVPAFGPRFGDGLLSDGLGELRVAVEFEAFGVGDFLEPVPAAGGCLLEPAGDAAGDDAIGVLVNHSASWVLEARRIRYSCHLPTGVWCRGS